MTLIREFDGEQEATLQLDRRRDMRLPQEREVRIGEPYAGRSFDGVTLDISSTGMRLRLAPDCRLRVGRLLNVHVGLNAFGCSLANRRSVITARVVWLQNEEACEGGFVVAGIELLMNVSATAA